MIEKQIMIERITSIPLLKMDTTLTQLQMSEDYKKLRKLRKKAKSEQERERKVKRVAVQERKK